MAEPRPAPLTVGIGESVFALGKRAPALVKPDRMIDDSPIMVVRLAELTVVVDDRPLPLPPTRFAQIEQVAGVVTGIRTAPMAGYSRLDPAHGMALWLVKHATAHGWSVTERKSVDPDAVRARAAKPGHAPIRQSYAVLERGSVSLRVVLEEASTPPAALKPASPEPLFLVHTDFADKGLRDARFAKLFAKRKQMTGGTKSVPLSAWVGA